MGRPLIIPSSSSSSSNSLAARSSNSALLSLPVLLAASIAATFAIFVTLCVTHHRKSSSQPPTPKKHKPTSSSDPSIISSSSSSSTTTSDKSSSVKKPTDTSSTEAHAAKMTTMSPPPAERIQYHDQEQHIHESPLVLFDLAATHGPIGPAVSAPVHVSTPPAQPRRLSASLSMRLTERVSKIRTNRKEKEKEKQHKEEEEEKPAVAEESVWMKTIILGERCKVPNSDDEEQEVPARYDEKGNKRRNYHPRTPRSLPVSRTNSFTAVVDNEAAAAAVS